MSDRVTEKSAIKIVKYQKRHGFLLKCEMTGLKDKGHALPPLPLRGPHKSHRHTHRVTSLQSPSNLQHSTPTALISTCSMGSIPNHSVLHPHPLPPPLLLIFWRGHLKYFQAIRVNARRENFWKEFLTKMLIANGENSEKKFLKG